MMIALFLFCSSFSLQLPWVISFSRFLSWPMREVEFLVKNPIKIHYISGDMILSHKSLVKATIFCIVSSKKTEGERESHRASVSNNQIHNTHAFKPSFNLIECESSNNPHSQHISIATKLKKNSLSPLDPRNSMESQWRAQVHFINNLFKKKKQHQRTFGFFKNSNRWLKIFKSDKNKTSRKRRTSVNHH